jgi:hypothetical protein
MSSSSEAIADPKELTVDVCIDSNVQTKDTVKLIPTTSTC